MRHLLAGALALATFSCTPAMAADPNLGLAVITPAGFLPAQGIYCADADGRAAVCTFTNPRTVETALLVTGNAAAAPATLYGGDYILDQVCASYGSLKLQRLGPDGTTWLDTLTKSAADTTTGTGVTVGGGAQVRAIISGTTGCNATLSRVP